MRKIIFLLFISFIVFSCKSKKAIATKKPNTEKVVVNNTEEAEVETETKASKIYANDAEKYIDQLEKS